MIEFSKFHGAGNDFIMIDNRDMRINQDKIEFAKNWCERRFGIGSDGVIFIENSTNPTVDFVMDFYNPDGSQSFCGNGSRCAVAFAKELGIVENTATFEAIDGIHEARIEAHLFHIHMGDVHDVQSISNDFFIHTGSPHYISYCDKDDQRDIVEFGKKIRYSDTYAKDGVNVNLVEVVNDNQIKVRTYERGVEAETLACGTGVTAAALSFGLKQNINEGIVKVDVKGGKLQVKFKRKEKTFHEIWLIGPAEFVFSGRISS